MSARPVTSEPHLASGDEVPDIAAERAEVAFIVRASMASLSDPDRRLRPALSHLHEPKEHLMSELHRYLDNVHNAGDIDIANHQPLGRPEPFVATPTGLKIIDTMAPVVRGGHD